ncbi:RluA family pseudouridine synthase [Hydrogenoanaerobacterium sp.]|uniref:RluA family pseudouridine synthase n=1 Tax=Hydrogenoanaerobacterium sp. TaxID=2953763 RepID=UPI0028A0C1CA|nr:RluA family pseudouridine synthase [Hydrogenoanaerobacterium sp.]
MSRTISFSIKPQFDGMKIYDYLRKEQHLSYRLITSLKHIPEGIELNGVHARTIDHVKTGDILSVTMPPSENDSAISDICVPIVYDDEDVLIYNKPADMNCHQSRRVQNDTLANVFAGYCQRQNLELTFRCINRLDKNTSGLVMLAKNQHAAALLKNAAQKEYLALVHGVPAKRSGTIDAPISRINDVYTKRQVDENGQPAVTHYEVLAVGEGFSLIQLRLETGRTHQIRVHMASIGHPLAGDDMYGGDHSVISRQALHCARMTFISPISRRPVNATAPLAEDIKLALTAARIYSDYE